MLDERMWAQQLTTPRRFERVIVDAPRPNSLKDGEVLVRTLAGGICGSDLPFFRGAPFPFAKPALRPGVLPPGAPLHEIAGVVISSRDRALSVGEQVVGWATGGCALSEYVITEGRSLIAYDATLAPDEAVVIQPLACVIHAVNRMPAVPGRCVAVLGQGPIGLLFSRILKDRGAAAVIGVDLVDRRSSAAVFGVDVPICASARSWSSDVSCRPEPDLVVEAIGHQVGTLTDAINVVAPYGYVYYFGIPDDNSYSFPMETFLRKHATLRAGSTPLEARRDALHLAHSYLCAHREILSHYVTHSFSMERASDAFDLASEPAGDRLKVVLTAL